MISSLVHRGFGHGSGMLSPDGQVFIINIPKNASSFVHDWAIYHGWRAVMCQNLQGVAEMIVLLRDPIERWVSGIAQYINTYILGVQGPNGPVFPDEPVTVHDYVMDANRFIEQYTDATERLIVDNAARFDDHVWPQSEIVQDILPGSRRRYFRVDHTLDQALADGLGWQPVQHLMDHNSGSSNQNTRQLQEFFRQRLQIRPELLIRLRRHYQQDYRLIDQVLT